MTKVVQFISFSSIYNDKLQENLKKNKYFMENFELECINLQEELADFEYSKQKKSYHKMSIIEKIFFWKQFNEFLFEKYSMFENSMVHIQFVNHKFVYLLPFLNRIANRIILSFWGSDLLRQGQRILSIMKLLFNKADKITFETDEMERIFLAKVGSKYQNKIYKVKFGLSQLEIIDNIESKDITHFVEKYRINDNKKCVVIGYNRNKEQQHIKAIESIVRNNNKNDIFIIIPWTYGENDPKYKERIELLLVDKYDYVFLENKLSDLEIAVLRRITDILIQVQTTDSFSATMLETLYAENQVITGSWLPYEELYNRGVVMETIDSIEECGLSLNELIKKDKNKIVLRRNKEIVYSISGWKNNIDKWIQLYS